MTYQHQLDRAEATMERIAATVERTEHLLAAVLDTLVAMRPENMPKRMPSPPGAHMLAAFPPAMVEPEVYVLGDDDYGRKPDLLSFTNANLSPEMRAAILASLPLPPARPAGSLTSVNDLPDRSANPGATNPDVTQENMATTIFVSGWTATVRPAVAFTNALKRQQLIEYGYPPDTDPSLFEEDHIVPLECGGAPHDAANLWPQKREGQWGARVKDLTENAANAALRAGTHTLQEIQDGFKTDWKALHTALFSNPAVVRGLMAMQPPEDEP